MFEYIDTHMPGFWVAVGFAMLAAEVLIFGFTTLILLFAGIGAIVTGLLMMTGILPETWVAGVSAFGIATGISAVLLWRPMRTMQTAATPQQQQSNDFDGLEFVLEQTITTGTPGKHRYSGIDWKVVIDDSSEDDEISAGERVRVASAEVGVFRVTKKD
jgi:membrane protein implicated in regulation of membrane protease activity